MENSHKEENQMNKKPSPRERIIRTATRLFYAQGVLSTGINQIIAESDIAKATFYQHFPSKNDLIRECILHYNEYITSVMIRTASASDTFDDFVREWVIQLKKDMQLNYRGCPIAEAAFHVDYSAHDIGETISEIIDKWYVILDGIFNAMKRQGQLAENVDNRLLAQRMIHLHEGALTMYRLTNDLKYIDDLDPLMAAVLNLA